MTARLANETASMNCLLLITQMEAGGAQTAMLQLARGLKARGHDVTVVTMYDKGGFIPRYEWRFGLRILDLEMKPAGGRHLVGRLFSMARGVVRLYRLMRSGGYEVLQTFSHYANNICIPLGWLARIPVRISSQRSSLRGAPGWLHWIDRFTANHRMTSLMIAVSESTREHSIKVEGIGREKVLTIPNGIDLARFDRAAAGSSREDVLGSLGLESQRPVVLCVARLHPQKGHAHLLEALPLLLPEHPRLTLLLAGEGALRGELEGHTAVLGLEGHVRFLGVRDDVPALMKACDVFVLPSLWEGLPNSVLEAMAAGLPIVATRVDGTTEAVQDGATGLLVPPGDPSALAGALAEVLREPERAKAMAARGREVAETDFSLEDTISRFEAVYRTTLSEIN